MTNNNSFSSMKYWEDRYRSGRNSGSGSYGRLAQFKADFLNTFFENNDVQSVVELGCGDGNQLTHMTPKKYVGFDVSSTAVKMCREMYEGNQSFDFFSPDDNPDLGLHDVALSLDVLYHLVEFKVFSDYMTNLFNHGNRFVIIYSSNFDAPWPNPHVLHRNITKFVEEHIDGWELSCLVSNAYPFNSADVDNTSFSDFMVFSKPCTPCVVHCPGRV